MGNMEIENVERMKLFEMIRNADILQRVMIVLTIIWLLIVFNKEWGRTATNTKIINSFDYGDFAVLGLIPIIAVWGLYWIINGVKEWYYKK